MSLVFSGSAGDYLSYGANRPLTITTIGSPGGAWTCASWIRCATDPTTLHIFFGDNDLSGGASAGHTMWIDQADFGTDHWVSSTNTGTASFSDRGESESVVNATWQSLVTTWQEDSATGINFYVDGVLQSTNFPASTSGGGEFNYAITNWVVGTRPGFAGNFPPNANSALAEVAYWNRILTAHERAALDAGASPLFFGEGLIWYIPFRTKLDVEMINGVSPTETGTGLTSGEHPPIVYPTTMPWSRQAAGVGGGGVSIAALARGSNIILGAGSVY